MSNKPDERDEDDIPETDFSGGVRGKYYERAMRGTKVVLREYLSEHGAPPIVPKQDGGLTSR
jgi:hypothetical protein